MKVYYESATGKITSYVLEGDENLVCDDECIDVDDSEINDIEKKQVNLSTLELEIIPTYDQDFLESRKLWAKQKIDAKAEEVRSRHLTPGSGQTMTYQEKAEEAADFIAAGYPVGDLASYPFIQADMNALGLTAEQAADAIVAAKSSWIAIGTQIEELRLGGKKNVDEAVDMTELAQEYDITITALDAL